jgi:hypothetical protein
MDAQSRSGRRRAVAVGFTALALIALGGIRILQFRGDPDVPFLTSEADSQWIRVDSDFRPQGRRSRGEVAFLRHRFDTGETIEEAWLTVRAMKRAMAFLDGKPLYQTADEAETWKRPRRDRVPFPIEPGTHELILLVSNPSGPAAGLAYSDELALRTGPDWEASRNGKDWTPARPVSRAKPAAISRQFRSPSAALRQVLPWLLPVFAVVFAWTFWGDRGAEGTRRLPLALPTPGRVRWALLLSWTVLAVNNMIAIPAYVGFDAMAHFQYIRFVATNQTLPLANQGWQAFQAPLYYAISAPIHALFADAMAQSTLIKLQRIVPLLCGLVQIEILYRTARVGFPARPDLQIIATVAGALLPMRIYMCQVVGNEPLAGCLTSLVILMALCLLTDEVRRRGGIFVAGLGVVWGLAILSKVTAIILAPLLLIAIAVHGRKIGDAAIRLVGKGALLFGACLATAGWFFVWNWIRYGKPLVHPGDPIWKFDWSQDPGYRTWSQLASFGESLSHPVYSGAVGFWDSLYSTLWLDGFLSGIAVFRVRPPWNDDFMLVGAWLGLIPTALLLLGLGAPLRKRLAESRAALLFASGCLVLYIAAILDVWLRLPVYSAAKASYTLGLAPCYGLLIAAGAEAFLRGRFTRSLTVAMVSCWAVAAFLAYFVRTGG